jgi:anti-sigma factor RsiW
VTHLGQRLSALIDGELEGSERDYVLRHVTRCDACREEAAALRALKNRLRSAAADAAAGAGLTDSLIRAVASLAERDNSDNGPAAAPQRSPWPDRPDGASGRGQASAEQRIGRYFLAGSLAVFLAGLGTAAFIAGGEPQSQAPTPPVAPSVDVVVFPHGTGNDIGTLTPIMRPSTLRPRAAISTRTHT